MKRHDNGNDFHWQRPQMARRSNNHGQGVRHHTDKPAPDMKKRGVRIVARFGCTEGGKNLRQKIRYSRDEIREHDETQARAAAFKRNNIIVYRGANIVERVGKILKPVFKRVKEKAPEVIWLIDWLRDYRLAA